MICRICKTTTGPFRARSTTLCTACDNARARADRLARLQSSIDTVDVVIPCEPTLEPLQAYHAMSAIVRRMDAIHDNGAVAVVIEPGQIRFRLFTGAMPCWMQESNHRWEPIKIADFSTLVDWQLDLQGERYQLGTPTVEQLRPCRVLRIVAMEQHGERKTKQHETLRRRLLAGGVLSVVAFDGAPYVIQTGGANVQERNFAVCTPLRIYTATERDGLVAQSRPIGRGGRYGAGVAVALPEDHDLTIPTQGLRTLKNVVAELQIDTNTVQYWMRRMGYDWLHAGHGRYFDDVVVQRLREAAPVLKWRQNGPRTRQYWTEEEELAIWDGIERRAEWKTVAQRVGRSYRACILKARHLRAEAREVAA